MKHINLIFPVIMVLAVGAMVLIAVTGDDTAAVVNGERITAAELKRAVASRSVMHIGTGAQVSSDMLRASVLDELISEVLLLQGAREAGIVVTDEEVQIMIETLILKSGQDVFDKFLKTNHLNRKQYAAGLRERMLKDRFVSNVVFINPVTDEEIKSFYKESPMPLIKPASAVVRIVEFATMEGATAAADRIEKEGFDTVAEDLSKQQTAFVSQYGETSPSFYSGEVGDAMLTLKEGTHGGPYKGVDGYFLIRVKARTPETPKTFEESAAEIRSMLNERRRSTAVIHWVANRVNSSTIERGQD